MPNQLPIGTEYDEAYLGLRVRVVGHHKDQFGQVVNDVVKVSDLPRKGRSVKRVAPSRARRPQRRRYRRRSVRAIVPVAPPREPSKPSTAWAVLVWCLIGLGIVSCCELSQRKIPNLYTHGNRR